jgi:hypothetical protein
MLPTLSPSLFPVARPPARVSDGDAGETDPWKPRHCFVTTKTSAAFAVALPTAGSVFPPP